MLLTHDLGPRRGTSRSVRRLRPQCRAGTAPGLSLDLEETVEAGDASSLGGDRMLRIAARTADIVGINGFFQIEGQPGLFRLCTAAAAGERNDWYLAVVPGRA